MASTPLSGQGSAQAQYYRLTSRFSADMPLRRLRPIDSLGSLCPFHARRPLLKTIFNKIAFSLLGNETFWKTGAKCVHDFEIITARAGPGTRQRGRAHCRSSLYFPAFAASQRRFPCWRAPHRAANLMECGGKSRLRGSRRRFRGSGPPRLGLAVGMQGLRQGFPCLSDILSICR